MHDNFKDDDKEENLEPIPEVNEMNQGSLNDGESKPQPNLEPGLQFMPE